MFCEKCGKEIPMDSNVCMYCGASVEDLEETSVLDEYGTDILEPNEDDGTDVLEDVYIPPVQPPQPLINPISEPQTDFGKRLSYIEFYNKFASKKAKNTTTTIGVICFITLAIGIVALFGYSGPLAFLDIAFYLVFGIIILKTKKWWSTLSVCIYSGIFSIIGFITSQSFTGIVALIVGIMATISLKRLDDAYKAYLVNGIEPNSEID